MQISRQEIADAAMVSASKVNKDIQRGRLDPSRLILISMYVVGCRMSAGVPSEITGLLPGGFEMSIDVSHKLKRSKPIKDVDLNPFKPNEEPESTHYEPCDDWGA